MDPRRFDSLARSLATPQTRRGLFGSVAAIAAGALGLRGARSQVTQAYCGNVTCRNNPSKCKDGCVCCDYGNGNSRCRPSGACSPGTEVGGTTPAPTTTTSTTTTTQQPTTSTSTTQQPTTSTTTSTSTTSTTAAPDPCTEDGADCPGGVCLGGVCCNTGPGLPGSEICDARTGGTCCSGDTICCGGDGCCGDCFVEDRASALCCPEESLCPPRSANNPEPPYCCRSGEICVADGSRVGCFISERVCNGLYCDGECCGGTECCGDGTYCSGGGCETIPVPPEVPDACLQDADCDPGLGCINVVRVLTEAVRSRSFQAAAAAQRPWSATRNWDRTITTRRTPSAVRPDNAVIDHSPAANWRDAAHGARVRDSKEPADTSGAYCRA